jgi:hypothetical protein
MLAVPQQYYFAYPSQPAPAALFAPAQVPVMPQLGAAGGVQGLSSAPGLMFPQRAAPGSMAGAPAGGLRQPRLHQHQHQHHQHQHQHQGSPGGMDQLASGFGSLSLQAGQQGLGRR